MALRSGGISTGYPPTASDASSIPPHTTFDTSFPPPSRPQSARGSSAIGSTIALDPSQSSATDERAIEDESIPPPGAVEALSSYPDGGLAAWTQVFCCSALFFTTLGAIYSWGVFQAALFKEGLAPASTLSYIGSTQAAVEAIIAIPVSRLVATYGPRRIATIGAVLTGLGPIIAGSVTHSVAGLMLTEGIMFGIGQSLCFFSAATLPSSYFLKKRNLATGLVYSGAGIGGAVFSILVAALLKRFGTAWAFRATGIIFLLINIPASLALRSRLPRQPLRSKQPIVEWAMFKDLRFNLFFIAGAIALFPLFVPPFFLPLYATSIGLTPATGSIILAGFNIASAAGRISFGFGADRILGSVNALSLCLVTVGLSTLAIWPVAESVGPLTAFAVINGFCAGGFFSLIPGVVSALFGSSKLGRIFGLLVSSWAPGYFLGAPVAGYILQANGGPTAGFDAYRPAIFYSGATSLVAAALIIAVRCLESRVLWKRV